MDDAEDKDDADRYRAPALDKGLDILELLAEQKEGLTRAEITKLLGRNASEMYRMLSGWSRVNTWCARPRATVIR